MAPTMKDLGIDRLSPEERVALALEIWESLGEARPRARLLTGSTHQRGVPRRRSRPWRSSASSTSPRL